MENYMCKTPVLLIFFNRPETFRQVFESVKRVKPPVLYLVQDGARESRREEDVKKIEMCREIVENIDWECEVYRNYSEKNMSCDPRVFSGISWAFETAERLIILEDDCVPGMDFYYFCDELLERYKQDERVQMICGTERMGSNPICKDSYYFSYVTAGCGWATWKRVWKDVEKYRDLKFMDDPYTMRLLEKWTDGYTTGIYKGYRKNLEKNREILRKKGKINSWETMLCLSGILESRAAISPVVNLVSYIGNSDDATHGGNIKTLPRHFQKLFSNMSRNFPLEKPLKHPKSMLRNVACEEAHWKMWKNNGFKKLARKIEFKIRRKIY